MDLETLAGGGAQGLVAVLFREAIEGEIEFRGNEAARATGAEHHLIVLFLALNTVIAVILLVGTMEFEDLDRVLAEVGGVLAEFGGEGFPEVVTGGFETFDFGEFGGDRGLNHRIYHRDRDDGRRSLIFSPLPIVPERSPWGDNPQC